MRTQEQPLTVGARVYYGGDICNREGFGTIVRVNASPFASYDIRLDDGRRHWSTPLCAIGYTYDGTGRTTYVTEAAYRVWRSAILAQYDQFRRV